MSKVYSFRLDDNNPREAQARVVINTREEEGYSLRYIVTEALLGLNYSNNKTSALDLSKKLDQIIEMLQQNKKPFGTIMTTHELTEVFKASIKRRVKTGLKGGADLTK
jgi:hypothetical protein